MDFNSIFSGVFTTLYTSVTSWWNDLNINTQFYLVLAIFIGIGMIFLLKKVLRWLTLIFCLGGGLYSLCTFVPMFNGAWLKIVPSWETATLFNRVTIVFTIGALLVIFVKILVYFNTSHRSLNQSPDAKLYIKAYQECKKNKGVWDDNSKTCQ